MCLRLIDQQADKARSQPPSSRFDLRSVLNWQPVSSLDSDVPSHLRRNLFGKPRDADNRKPIWLPPGPPSTRKEDSKAGSRVRSYMTMFGRVFVPSDPIIEQLS